MTLSRKRPFPSHDWPDSDADVVSCQEPKCGAEWDRREYDDPPPWSCVRSQLARTGSLDRSAPLSPISDDPFEHPNEDEAFRGWVRERPCLTCGEQPPSDPHHVRSRNSGHSDWLDDGTGNLVPLCRACHDALDSVGGGKQTFEVEHGVSLVESAEIIGDTYREER